MKLLVGSALAFWALFSPVLGEDKFFVILITSHNNETYVEANLASVFKQNYANYRVVYIDDASTDGTVEKVEEMVRRHRQQERFILIKNGQQKKGPENIYHAVRACDDREVVVMLNGDDWLSEERVLERLNKYYSGEDVWMTYGSYYDYPRMTKGEYAQKMPYRIMKHGGVRAHLARGWILSHLQTFYAGLFKQIKLQDFLYRGAFFENRADHAYMIPIMEMARRHAQFLEEVMYIRNCENPLNEEKVSLSARNNCNDYILQLPAYPVLATFPENPPETAENTSSDIVVFSLDRPMQLYACLESIRRYVVGFDRITVIYRYSDDEFAKAYQQVQAAFPKVSFIKQAPGHQKDFKPLMLASIYGHPAEYITFVADDIVVKDHIDFKECIRAMKKTGAHGFYLRLGKNIDYCYRENCTESPPESIPVEKGIYAWQFEMGGHDWAVPCSMDMTLYKKGDIHDDLAAFGYISPNTLELAWTNTIDRRKVGLYFTESKVVNIPLNMVNVSSNRHMESTEYDTRSLLALFRDGMKMDINGLFRINNRSVHIEHEPAFKRRS
jgi:glycosyltransferase involved in cell wall biosynthesis